MYYESKGGKREGRLKVTVIAAVCKASHRHTAAVAVTFNLPSLFPLNTKIVLKMENLICFALVVVLQQYSIRIYFNFRLKLVEIYFVKFYYEVHYYATEDYNKLQHEVWAMRIITYYSIQYCSVILFCFNLDELLLTFAREMQAFPFATYK
jgi:hypothetical protein